MKAAKVQKLVFLLFCPVLFAEQKFWEKQSWETWTPDQIKRIETDSPWAKQVVAQLTSNESNMANPNSRNGSDPIPRGNRSYGSNVPKTVEMPKMQATVQWVSAVPLREPMKLHLPKSLEGHYVIGVSGIPLNPDTADAAENTFIELKRGNLIHPETAYLDPADESTMYFGFLPSTLDLTTVKMLTFVMDIPPYKIKVRFNIADMKYRGVPAF